MGCKIRSHNKKRKTAGGWKSARHAAIGFMRCSETSEGRGDVCGCEEEVGSGTCREGEA